MYFFKRASVTEATSLEERNNALRVESKKQLNDSYGAKSVGALTGGALVGAAVGAKDRGSFLKRSFRKIKSDPHPISSAFKRARKGAGKGALIAALPTLYYADSQRSKNESIRTSRALLGRREDSNRKV